MPPQHFNSECFEDETHTHLVPANLITCETHRSHSSIGTSSTTMPSRPCTSSSNSASYSYVQEDEDYSNFQEQLQGLSLSTMTQSNKPESILRRRSYGLATSESPTQPSFLKFLPSHWPIRRTKVHFPPDSAMVSSTICRPYTHILDIPTLFYSSYEIRVFKREYRQLAHEERERQRVEATETGTSVKGSRRSRRRRSVDSYDSSQGIVEQFKRQQWRKMKRDLNTSSSSSVSSSSTSISAHDNTFWRSKVPRGRLTTSSRGKLTGSSSSVSVPSGSTQLCRKMSSLGMDNDSEEDSWDPLNDDDDASSCGSWIDDDSVERRKRELAAKNSSSSSSPLRPPGAAALSEDEESYIDDDSTIASSDSFFASIFPNASSGIQDDVAKDAMYSALEESHLDEDDIDVLEQKMLEALEDSSPSPSCIPRSPPLVVDLSAGILPTGKHSGGDASGDCDDANLPSSQPQGLFSSVFDSAAEAVSILNGNSYLDHLDAPSSSSSSQKPSSTSAETEKVEHVKSKRIPCNTSSHMVDTLYLF